METSKESTEKAPEPKKIDTVLKRWKIPRREMKSFCSKKVLASESCKPKFVDNPKKFQSPSKVPKPQNNLERTEEVNNSTIKENDIFSI